MRHLIGSLGSLEKEMKTMFEAPLPHLFSCSTLAREVISIILTFSLQQDLVIYPAHEAHYSPSS